MTRQVPSLSCSMVTDSPARLAFSKLLSKTTAAYSPSGASFGLTSILVEIAARLSTLPNGARAFSSASCHFGRSSASRNLLPAAAQLASASPLSASASQASAADCAAVARGSCASAPPAPRTPRAIAASSKKKRAAVDRCTLIAGSGPQELVDGCPGNAPLRADLLALQIALLEAREDIGLGHAQKLRDLRRREQLGRRAGGRVGQLDPRRRLTAQDPALLVHYLLRHRHSHRHLGTDRTDAPAVAFLQSLRHLELDVVVQVADRG